MIRTILRDQILMLEAFLISGSDHSLMKDNFDAVMRDMRTRSGSWNADLSVRDSLLQRPKVETVSETPQHSRFRISALHPACQARVLYN